jgi:two-component system nitrate/nitrite sensor histidine kinase NarX
MASTQSTPSSRQGILFTVGILMAIVVALAITDMLSSMFIAQINQGMATAVNQSGTLRMQLYRIAAAVADATLEREQRRQRIAALAAEFEQRLKSPRLTDALPAAANDPVRLAYERVRWRWSNEMRHALDALALDSTDSRAREVYLGGVDDFVDDIHSLVRVLEERAERRIRTLRWIHAVALVLTPGIVLITLWVVRRRVLQPLEDLLRCAERIRQRDFSARTRYTGADELGQLGSAMNLMTEGLSQIYNELEERVAETTHDLARTNHSLELLYRTSRTLDEAPISEQVLRRVLHDVRAQLHLADVILCLRDGQDVAGSGCIGTAPAEKPAADGGSAGCSLCAGPRLKPASGDQRLGIGAATATSVRRQTVDFLVGDRDRCFGLLRVVLSSGQRLESWQRPLLESLAGHVATALDLRGRVRESRRLILHEERSILARELHDSLAQSLSYLKIQAARLDAALREAELAAGGSGRNQTIETADADLPRHRAASKVTAGARPDAILAEIRAGINSAYRQLRELLTTFRLKMDGLGLSGALLETVQEFRSRGAFEIELDDRLPQGLLSPNEEVHVLQIVREALSNVVRHARAEHCGVSLTLDAGQVIVEIADDGVGLSARQTGGGPDQTPASAPDWAHYGAAIMRERAASLGGSIKTRSAVVGGTVVSLRFRPRALLSTDENGVPSMPPAARAADGR